jgi:Amt family ammonium transporter
MTMAGPAAAAAAPLPVAVGADTAWILTSTALVLFMTIPGLSAFYGGLVKRECVLSVLMQCFAITCMVSIMWVVCGYSLSFSTVGMVEGAKGMASFVGGLDKSFLSGVGMSSLNGTIPEALWVLFQMTFAIITPALMIGSFVERMKFNAIMWYVALWMVAVYFPFCHMVWGGPGALLADMGVIDFAGGIVVHITAGIGALVGCIMLGPRKENKLACDNLTLTCLGTGMLWVGWFGFNGGSAGTAGAEAAFACLATQISAATAAFVWMLQDLKEFGKASLVGICTGSIAGLATITPAAGSVGPLGALCIGICAGIVCRFFSTTVKEMGGYDDSLDVVGVHGVGGFLGTCILGIFGNSMFGGFVDTPMMQQTIIQCSAAVGCALYTAVASFICLKIAAAISGGLRVPAEAEGSTDKFSHDEGQYPLTA